MLVQLLQMNLYIVKLIKLEYHKVTSHQSVELLKVLLSGDNSSCAIPSQNHPRENIVLRHCQDQVNTGLPLCQINFRDTVRGMLFGRKLGSHCLDGAVQLLHSFCLELRFFFKDAAICISAPRPGFVWERASVPFRSFYFFSFKSPSSTEPELKLRTTSPIH